MHSRRSTKRRSTKFRCPECGFRAAHAMGLGRHRSAKHGVVSQRMRQRSGTDDGRVSRGDFSRLQARVVKLERRYERLVRNLSTL
jgi:hypothetical protein